MSPAQGDEARRVLVVAAHPDDIEFGCAGTIAKWRDRGDEVTYVIATSGERGSQDATDDPDEFGALRRREAEAAAAVVGVDEITWLGFEDGTTDARDEALLEAIARQFRRVRPHVVITMLPDLLPGGPFINHPDHRAVATATLDVCLAAGTTGGWFRHLQLDEGLPSWKGVEEIRLFGPGVTDHLEDVSDHLDRKLEALGCHASQVGPETLERVERWLASNGRLAGVAHAEGARLLATRG